MLQQSQKEFIKSDESAFSIVPSRMSSRDSLSTIQTGDRDSITGSESLVYRRFSFENDLFTARVYKRNYRNTKYQGPRKQKLDRDVEAVDPRKGGPQSSELANPSILDQESIVRDGNVSTEQEYGDLVEACRIGDNAEVSKRLKTASTYGGTEALNILLSRKCDLVHLCPMHATVFGGHLDVMETLLQHAHSEHKTSENLPTLLFCAGRDYVMDNGQKQRSILPLHSATIKGDLSMVDLLLRMGAPIDTKWVNGVQAIHLAAKIGSFEVLTALIAAGANVNCRDREGRQPMHYLSEIQRPEIIQYLAENGADIDGVFGMSQATPLGFAFKKGIDANAKALLSLGALVTSPIFDTIFEHGSLDLIETLLISAANQQQGKSVMAASLFSFFFLADLSDLMLHWNDASRKRRKLRLLLQYTDLLLKNWNGDTVLYSLFEILWPQHGELLELVFLENLPDSKTLEKDEVRSFVRREEKRKISL